MLTVMKRNGATSSAGDTVKKGHRGRLELFASRSEDGSYTLDFTDYGNFGKERWSANFGTLTREDLESMIDALINLRDDEIDSTHLPFEDLQAQEAAPVETEEPESAPAVETTESVRGSATAPRA